MQHGCHTIKNSQNNRNWQNFNVFKMQQGSAKQNSGSALFVPFHKAFQKGRDNSQRGHILFCMPLVPPSRGQTSVTIKATREGAAAPLCVSSAPRAPQGAGGCAPHTSGQAGLKEGPVRPLADNRQCQAEFRGLAGKRQNVGILLEIRKGEKVSCVPRDSRLLVLKESLKTAHKSHAADLHCCAGICPLPLCCWLPQSHFLLPLTVSISLCLLLNLFLHPSHSRHFLPSVSRSYFCICASHTSPTTLLHTLPFSPPLLIYPQAFLTLLSFLHPTSPTPQQPRGVKNRGKQDKMGIPQDR